MSDSANSTFDIPAVEELGEAQFFRALLENTTDGVLTVDEGGTIIFANSAVRRLFGYSPDELVGESLTMLVPPERRQQYLDAVDSYLRSGERSAERHDLRLPGRHKDGHAVQFEISLRGHEVAGRRLFTGIVRDVTDRTVRERELERYERLVETAGDGIYQLDPSGRFAAVNDIVTEVTGYSRDQLLGAHVSLVLSDEDIVRCERVIQEQIAGESPDTEPLELDIHTADGDVVPGEVRLNVLESDGELRGTVGIVRDITERKRDEAERRLLHDTTRSIAEADTTVDGLYAVVESACEMTEWAYGEAWTPADDGSHLERTSAAYTVSEELDRFKERSRGTQFAPDEGLPGRVWAETEPEWIPNVAVSEDAFPRMRTAADVGLKAALGVPVMADGRVVAVLAFYMAEEKVQDNRLVDIVSTVATNLGTLIERKQQEDALKEQRRELARQRDELRTELEEVFDRVTDAFFGLDTDWEFTYVNPRAEELLERSADDLHGRNVWEAFPEATDSTFQEQYEHAMETQTVVDFEEYYEPLETWFEVRAYPSETGLSVYFRDVSDRKEYERALERQNERLEHFAHMLAHELRNPLTIARLYHPQAVDGDPEAAEQVAAALDRIETMIDILLITARGSESDVDWQPVDLRDAVEEAWADVSATGTDLVIETNRTVLGDPVHLQHLLENLFKNAVEHGGDDVTVRVGDLSTGFYLEDDGPGIPAEEREAAFEAGYTTETDGTGIGLAFVERLVETYGWNCTITESATGGARFEFTDVDVVSIE